MLLDVVPVEARCFGRTAADRLPISHMVIL
jgi:hypothetical protein